MKRLPIYLLIILGLGLSFNINANAGQKKIDSIESDIGISFYSNDGDDINIYKSNAIKYCQTKIKKNKAALIDRSLFESNKPRYTPSHSQLLTEFNKDIINKFAKNKMIVFYCINNSKDIKQNIVWSDDNHTIYESPTIKVETNQTKKITNNNDWRKNLAVEGTETENEDLLCLIKRNKSGTYSYFPVDRTEI